MSDGIELGRMLAGEKHAPVVYFVWCAGAVKVGTTTRLRDRLSSLYLRLSDVILVVPGGHEVERAYHDRLDKYWLPEPGHRELFALEGVLRELSLAWERPSLIGLDPGRSIGVPFEPSPLVRPRPWMRDLPEVRLTCRNDHAFTTRARGGSAVSCPACRRDGTRVNVWVPKGRPGALPAQEPSAENSGQTRL